MTVTAWDKASLRAEADFFHRALFGSPAPAAVAERYARSHEVCFRYADPAEIDVVERIVRFRLDPEAVECAFRLGGRQHLLTRKLHVLLYLVEVRREYYPLFFNEESAAVLGKLRVVAAVFRAAGKALRGRMLIRRYGLG